MLSTLFLTSPSPKEIILIMVQLCRAAPVVNLATKYSHKQLDECENEKRIDCNQIVTEKVNWVGGRIHARATGAFSELNWAATKRLLAIVNGSEASPHHEWSWAALHHVVYVRSIWRKRDGCRVHLRICLRTCKCLTVYKSHIIRMRIDRKLNLASAYDSRVFSAPPAEIQGGPSATPNTSCIHNIRQMNEWIKKDAIYRVEQKHRSFTRRLLLLLSLSIRIWVWNMESVWPPTPHPSTTAASDKIDFY